MEDDDQKQKGLDIFGGLKRSQQQDPVPNQGSGEGYQNEYNALVSKINEGPGTKFQFATGSVERGQLEDLQNWWKENSVTNAQYNQQVSMFNSMSKDEKKDFTGAERIDKQEFRRVRESQIKLTENAKKDVAYENYAEELEKYNKINEGISGGIFQQKKQPKSSFSNASEINRETSSLKNDKDTKARAEELEKKHGKNYLKSKVPKKESDAQNDLEYQKYSNLVDARNKVAGSSLPPVALISKAPRENFKTKEDLQKAIDVIKKQIKKLNNPKGKTPEETKKLKEDLQKRIKGNKNTFFGKDKDGKTFGKNAIKMLMRK